METSCKTQSSVNIKENLSCHNILLIRCLLKCSIKPKNKCTVADIFNELKLMKHLVSGQIYIDSFLSKQAPSRRNPAGFYLYRLPNLRPILGTVI